MGEDAKKYQFPAAIAIVGVCLAYLFMTAWLKPTIDHSSTVTGIVMLLIGYYWGSSKTSQERSEMLTKKEAAPGPCEPTKEAP